MQDHASTASGQNAAAVMEADGVRLTTRISPAVDRRLRMLALARRQPLSRVLSVLLDQALPPADELAALCTGSQQ